MTPMVTHLFPDSNTLVSIRRHQDNEYLPATSNSFKARTHQRIMPLNPTAIILISVHNKCELQHTCHDKRKSNIGRVNAAAVHEVCRKRSRKKGTQRFHLILCQITRNVHISRTNLEYRSIYISSSIQTLLDNMI